MAVSYTRVGALEFGTSNALTNKGNKMKYCLNESLTIKELAKFNKVHENFICEEIVKLYPILLMKRKVFNTIRFEQEKSKFKELFNDVSSLDEVKKILLYSGKIVFLLGCQRKFLEYLFSVDWFVNYIDTLYKVETTWGIAEELNLTSQKILVDSAKSKYTFNSSRSTSKIHLKMKPIIEKILGYKTKTEHTIICNESKIRVDEFCNELNLCIEIDKERDKKLIANNYSILRLPAYSSEDKIKSLISSWLGTRGA